MPGIHVPACVMGQFVIFCLGYWSHFVNLALVMGLLCTNMERKGYAPDMSGAQSTYFLLFHCLSMHCPAHKI